jgi:hypothetical protein
MFEVFDEVRIKRNGDYGIIDDIQEGLSGKKLYTVKFSDNWFLTFTEDEIEKS